MKKKYNKINLSQEFEKGGMHMLTSDIKIKIKKKKKKKKGKKKQERIYESLESLDLYANSFKESRVVLNDQDKVKLITKKPNSCPHDFFIKFHRMKLPFYIPLIFGCVFAFFLFFLGIFLLVKSNDIQNFELSYGDYCKNQFPGVCELPIEIQNTIKADRIHFFLKVENLSQNIKELVHSFSHDQLKGKDVDREELIRKCGILPKINSIKPLEKDKEELETKIIPDPCGFLPRLFPQDTFIQMENINNRNTYFPILKNDITSETTRTYNFYNNSTQWLDVRNEQFANWMKISSAKSWVKLWGLVKDEIPKGQYFLKIENYFNETSFDSNKKLVIAFDTNYLFSTKNSFVGTIIIVNAILICVFCILLVLVIVFVKKNQKTKNVDIPKFVEKIYY